METSFSFEVLGNEVPPRAMQEPVPHAALGSTISRGTWRRVLH